MSKDPRVTGRTEDRLTHQERVDLAVCHYGLYTFGNGPSWDPKSGVSYEVAKRFHDGDVAAAMDNSSVPWLWSGCSYDQQQTLLDLAKRRPELTSASNVKLRNSSISGAHIAKDEAGEPHPLSRGWSTSLLATGGFKRGELVMFASKSVDGQKKTAHTEHLASEFSDEPLRFSFEDLSPDAFDLANPAPLPEAPVDAGGTRDLIVSMPRQHGRTQALQQMIAGLKRLDPMAFGELSEMQRRGGKSARMADLISDAVIKDVLRPIEPTAEEKKPAPEPMVQEIHPPGKYIPFEERLEMAVEHWNLRQLKVPPKIRSQLTVLEVEQWVINCEELMDANGVPRRYGDVFDAMLNRSNHQKDSRTPELVAADIFGLMRRVSKVGKSQSKRS